MTSEVSEGSLNEHGISCDVSQEDLPFEVQYTQAVIRKLKRLVGRTNSLESPTQGKVDIHATLQDGSTFAIEAVMASRGRTKIAEHRGRFKRLLIIGKQDSNMRDVVGEVADGIEAVGLAANPVHSGYHVFVKRQSKEVVDFFIPCDGVASRFSWKDEEPFFEISSAQKLNYITPSWISSVNILIQELLYIVCSR